MKTLVLSMISIAATVAAMTACTSESDEINNVVEAPVEIELNAGVIQTKAAIEVDDYKHPKADINNVYFYREDVTGQANPSWTNPTGFVGKIETTGNIADIEQYYATNGDKTYIAGLYLGGNASTAPAPVTGKVSFTITGDEDILWANGIDKGDRNNPLATPLDFKHQLTQFKFITKTAAGVGEVSNITITVNNVNSESAISLVDGTFDAWKTPISPVISGLTAPGNAGTATASKGIMLEPSLKEINLSVAAPDYLKTPETLKISGTNGTNNDSFLAGKLYTITIEFKGKAVSATATVSDWDKGTDPSAGTIE